MRVESDEVAADEQHDPGSADPVQPPPAGPASPVSPAGPGDRPARRYPSTIGGIGYLVVLMGVGLGLVVASLGPWRVGVQMMAAALLLGALLRMVLPQRDAGMLAVRHRLIDGAMLSGAAAALIFLAQTIPNQPG